MLKVTTSWDDGDILDKRLADLLQHYGIKGTFYITKDYRPERLSDEDIREIAEFHEIGGHSLTHPDLRTVSPEKRREEVEGSKKWLEEILDHEVKMFCYPSGYFSRQVAQAAQSAGFRGARTTELGALALPDNPFNLKTTIQVYPFPFRKLNKKQLYFGRLIEPYQQRAAGLLKLGISRFSMHSWLSVAKAAFSAALQTTAKAGQESKVFHLWGHSWEIEKYGMWKDLEKFLKYISNHEKCIYLTNCELLGGFTAK